MSQIDPQTPAMKAGVPGYREVTPARAEIAKRIKEAEEILLRQIEVLETGPEPVDPRWIAIGRTQIQQGFMALLRGVMQPTRIRLPGDD